MEDKDVRQRVSCAGSGGGKELVRCEDEERSQKGWSVAMGGPATDILNRYFKINVSRPEILTVASLNLLYLQYSHPG